MEDTLAFGTPEDSTQQLAAARANQQAQVSQPSPEASTSQVGAFVRGGISDIPYHNQIVGGINAAAQYPFSGQSYSDLYAQAKAKEQAENAAAQAAYPKTYMAGQIGGGLATAYAMPTGVLSRAGAQTALSGAQSLGESDQYDSAALQQAASRAIKSGVTTLAFGAAAPAASAEAKAAEEAEESIAAQQPQPNISAVSNRPITARSSPPTYTAESAPPISNLPTNSQALKQQLDEAYLKYGASPQYGRIQSALNQAMVKGK